jgi:hypothetical protein
VGGVRVSEPVNLGERRMQRDYDCNARSPRELLSAMLSDADYDGIVVCYFRRENGGTITGMKRSKVTVMEAVAMIEMAKWDLLADSRA